MIRFLLFLITFISFSIFSFAQSDVEILNIPTTKSTSNKVNKPKVADVAKGKRLDLKDKIQQTQEALLAPNLPKYKEDSLYLVIESYRDSLNKANKKTIEVIKESTDDKNTLIDILKDREKEIRDYTLETHKVKCDSSNFDNFITLSFILTEKNRKKILSSQAGILFIFQEKIMHKKQLSHQKM
jgi:hypothetical protein